MKHVVLIIYTLSFLLAGCVDKPNIKNSTVPNLGDPVLDIPDRSVDLTELHFNKMTSIWTLNDQRYSGYAVSYYQPNILKEKIGFLNGRKQNKAITWFPDGHYKQVSNYYKGKLHGQKKLWSSGTNHVLIAHLNYNLGKAHGEQTTWYATGELYKRLQLNMGEELGMQQAFRKNGALYANYEAKKGRIFGLKKAALCFELEDEIVQYEK